MNTTPEIIRFVGETHACATQMLSNAAYIQKELPGLEMPDSLRDQIDKLCSDLIGSKHDLISEAVELEEVMVADVGLDRIIRRVKMILVWIQDDVSSIHQCVKAVNDAVKCGAADAILGMLIMESAANILHSTPARPAICDQSPEEDEEEGPVDDEDEDEDICDPNCYAFYSEDSYPIGQLIATIRRLMSRPDLPAETAANLKVFLFAMERLPLVTPGVRMSVGLRYDMGGESDWIEIRMEDGEFSLGRGTWTDGDADTETVFEVTPDYRECDAFIATIFAESFAECAQDACREVVIEDFSDEPFTGWDLPKNKTRWNDLPCSFL
jgi:hypothetical protein